MARSQILRDAASGLAEIPSRSPPSTTKLNGFSGAQTERSKRDVFDIEHLTSSVVVSVERFMPAPRFGGILFPTADAAASYDRAESLSIESERLCWRFI
jgi:hypothetical protein